MIPRIETLSEKRLVGTRLTMSLADYKIGELWRSFLPRRKEITHYLTTDLISVIVCNPSHFVDFKPTNEFERWAAVEVAAFDNVPPHMETFILAGGLYAVFEYKGLNTDNSIFTYILETWLPTSDYVLDNKPHFEVLGEKYKNNDPNSEEEIWIPIKAK
ncbi:GyrI-like domain-containing protein [Algoriphagus litoralis]|uniref:GyrI-like domain-containing protein n=1 Tax=Algoriphagus litoralis TaxID=2202829 RepID=UPI000DB93AF6|nr:GyrI-like domain-containing protein [Algoriphagus litoralis]